MAVHVRGVEEAELPPLMDVLAAAFGETLSDEENQDELDWIEADRVLVAEDDGDVVGVAGAYSFRMTIPGGSSLQVAGVTWVGVVPTHRRRGVLTSMMRRQLDDVVERGEPIAVLTASEAGIYGRFGYGLASRTARVRIDTATPLPLLAEPSVGGRFRMATGSEAEAHARRLLDEVLPRRVGELTRPERWWPVFQRDRESRRREASARFWVLHESSAGAVDGVAHYRVKQHRLDDAIHRNEVVLGDIWTADAEVEAALLVFLSQIDLTTSVTTWCRPVDDAFRLRLGDDRRYRVEILHDYLYVRLLDVPAALAARQYGSPGAVVLGVDDDFRPATSGRYRLSVDDDGAGTCERIGDLHDGDADAFLTVADLASIYLGDVSARQLADAGRLLPSSPAAPAAIDRLFATERAPFCTMQF